MIKNIICIECPIGCSLNVDLENGKMVSISGHKCPKGESYAINEVENPQRILTSTVKTHGLSLKMVSVRTDRAIPKEKIHEAIKKIKETTLHKPIYVGDVIIADFLELDVNLIATRDCLY